MGLRAAMEALVPCASDRRCVAEPLACEEAREEAGGSGGGTGPLPVSDSRCVAEPRPMSRRGKR